MDNKFELNMEELAKVNGGEDGLITRTVEGLKKGFLAIRSAAAYDSTNELGALYNGDFVYSTEVYSGVYVWVYAECKKDPLYGRPAYSGYGWVNSGYLSALK